jgi:hypothetical protein
MMNKIEQFADTLKSGSRELADRAIKGMRTAGHETADLIVRTKRPVHAVANTGMKLNNLSHKSIEKMLKQQVRMIDDLLDGSAERIETAARARTLKGLLDGQVSTLPKTRKHVVKNAKKTVSLARDTGDAFGDLFKDVVVDISSARKGAKPAAKKKAAGRPAAKKKAPGRKPAAKKTAAKKRVARKAPAKKTTDATQAA